RSKLWPISRAGAGIDKLIRLIICTLAQSVEIRWISNQEARLAIEGPGAFIGRELGAAAIDGGQIIYFRRRAAQKETAEQDEVNQNYTADNLAKTMREMPRHRPPAPLGPPDQFGSAA